MTSRPVFAGSASRSKPATNNVLYASRGRFAPSAFASGSHGEAFALTRAWASAAAVVRCRVRAATGLSNAVERARGRRPLRVRRSAPRKTGAVFCRGFPRLHWGSRACSFTLDLFGVLRHSPLQFSRQCHYLLRLSRRRLPPQRVHPCHLPPVQLPRILRFLAKCVSGSLLFMARYCAVVI